MAALRISSDDKVYRSLYVGSLDGDYWKDAAMENHEEGWNAFNPTDAQKAALKRLYNHGLRLVLNEDGTITVAP